MGAYQRRVDPFDLILTFVHAFLVRATGLRDVLDRYGSVLGTPNPSTLSYALGSAVCHRLVHAMLDRLTPARFGNGLVAIDGMAVSLPKTRRHHCAKVNNATVGGGVLWALALDGPRNRPSPVRLLATMRGSWCDAKILRGVRLEAFGPVYLMDRGCYCIDLLADWLCQGVRFVVRARAGKNLAYEVHLAMGNPRTIALKKGRSLAVEFDGQAILGSAKRRGARPLVRLIVGTLRHPGGKSEQLVVVSSELKTDARMIVAAYGRRWEIERFHKILKRVLGLAHLYSFRQSGIEFLLAVCLLTAILLWAATGQAGAVLDSLYQAIKTIRKTLHIHRLWSPNTVGKNAWRQHRGKP